MPAEDCMDSHEIRYDEEKLQPEMWIDLLSSGHIGEEEFEVLPKSLRNGRKSRGEYTALPTPPPRSQRPKPPQRSSRFDPRGLDYSAADSWALVRQDHEDQSRRTNRIHDMAGESGETVKYTGPTISSSWRR